MEVSQYLDVFLDESREHLQAINDNILLLEKDPENLGLVNEIFRSAHTLKGMAATMGYEDLATLTHKMENVLDLIRNEQLSVTTEVVDIIFDAIEYLEDMVADISEGRSGEKDVTELGERLERMGKGEISVSKKSKQSSDPISVDLDDFQLTIVEQAMEQAYSAYQITVEVSENSVLKGARAYMVFGELETRGEVIKTTPVTEEIEEGNFDTSFELIFLSKETKNVIKSAVLSVSEIKDVTIQDVEFKSVNEDEKEEEKVSTDKKHDHKSNEVEQKAENKVQHATYKTIRVNLERIDDLLNLFEEVVIDQSRLNVISDEIRNPDLVETVEHMNRVSSDMQDLILSMRMVPVDQVFNRFPRMIRGLARDMDKKIKLEIVGADTELDRTVIDEIGDPLVHLIRNSVDHGIEMPEERKSVGKLEEGNIILRAFHSGNHVFIEIEDDGAGINAKKVKAKAVENGIVTEEEAQELSQDEVANLILVSGFSTADKVSDVSGRGVGLDVVKNKIVSLGGSISIKSEEGKGSIFSIQLPLTLSIISTLLVKCRAETFAVPLSSIIETVLLKKEQVITAHGQKVMDFRGSVIPLLDLQSVFDIPEAGDEKDQREEHAIVVLKKGDKLTGIIVDEFIGQQELVLKSLGDYLGDVFAISGATILGDGEVALIIDPNALIK